MAALSLAAGAFAFSAQADETEPRFRAPKGYKVADAPSKSGTPSPRIIGGTTTSFSSAPYMVQLLYDFYDDGYLYFNCGGTLVAPNKVLTAAHCVTDEFGSPLNFARDGLILAGTSKLVGGPTNSEGTAVNVSRQWVHPGYSTETFSNDIAVLTLSKPLPYKPLPLAGPGDLASYNAGTNSITLGWGLTSSDADTATLASTLQQVVLPLHSNQECVENLNPFFQDNGTMFCAGQAGTGSDATGKTPCPGDSGGPVLVKGKVVGVVSWGINSADGQQLCNVVGAYEAFAHVANLKPAVQPRIDDADLTRDGRADLFARTSAGADYSFASNGVGFTTKTAFSGTYSGYNIVAQTDLNRDGYQDFVVRQTSNGELRWVRRSPTSSTYVSGRIATGFGTYRAILAPGDVTGDALPDVVGVSSSGALVVLPGNGAGGVGTLKVIGSGYQKYNAVRGHGDFNGDSLTDLFVRNSSSTALYLIPGTGNAAAPFGTPVLQASSWGTYNLIVTPGDVSGDGKPDVVTRSSNGALQLHRGNGTTTGTLRAPVQAGTGFSGYNLFG
ncbi:trypsin-like serine protease [Streptomyces sp. NPDC001970]